MASISGGRHFLHAQCRVMVMSNPSTNVRISPTYKCPLCIGSRQLCCSVRAVGGPGVWRALVGSGDALEIRSVAPSVRDLSPLVARLDRSRRSSLSLMPLTVDDIRRACHIGTAHVCEALNALGRNGRGPKDGCRPPARRRVSIPVSRFPHLYIPTRETAAASAASPHPRAPRSARLHRRCLAQHRLPAWRGVARARGATPRPSPVESWETAMNRSP